MPDEMEMGNRPPNRPGQGSRRPSYGSGGGQGGGSRPRSGGSGGGGNTGGTGHKGGKSSCSMAIPVAVAMLPYALARLALDGWRSRRGRDAS